MSDNPNYPHDRGCGPYRVPDYAESLLRDALERLEDREDSLDIFYADGWSVPGLTLRPFWWGDDAAPELALPNFAFGGVRIWFYKYWGRGMSCDVDWTPDGWIALWRALCLAIDASEEDDE